MSLRVERSRRSSIVPSVSPPAPIPSRPNSNTRRVAEGPLALSADAVSGVAAPSALVAGALAAAGSEGDAAEGFVAGAAAGVLAAAALSGVLAGFCAVVALAIGAAGSLAAEARSRS